MALACKLIILAAIFFVKSYKYKAFLPININ